jgi:tRNA U34 5-methylaminomethyl-2-thiouridine-forming methyltransferase MnmC
MWQISNLQKVRDVMQEGGFFVTYCAKGQLKRDLQTLGFLVEKLPKPPHKREMTQSILQNNK